MLEGKKILVVDGDDLHNKTVGRALQQAGADPIAVKTAEQAITLLEEQDFDLVLMDLRLPLKNGYELCRELSCSPRLALIPVVATSINPFINSINIAICPNVVDFLRKPFRIEEMLEVIDRVLSGKPGSITRLMRRRA